MRIGRKEIVDENDGTLGVLLTDLSKALDYLLHNLLIAKLDAYGFDKSSLKLIHSLPLKNKIKSRNI